MKGREVVQSLRARRDLVEIFGYYAREAGHDTARRFFVQADATFERLATMPGLGARFEPGTSASTDLRFSPIARFKNYLVFYRPIEGGIEIVRVLHGARDIPGLLAEEFGVGGDEDPFEDGEDRE